MDTLTTLLQKQKELSSQIESLRNQQKKEGLKEIVALVEKYQFTPAEVMNALTKQQSGSKKRGSVAPKYRDPQTGATWTGRGKAPSWIANKDRDAFLIP